MTTLPLVDPSLLPLLEFMPGAAFTADNLAQVRDVSEQRFAFLGEPALQAVVKVIDGPGGPLEIYWYDPQPGAQGRATMVGR